jgi:uncharacterized protein YbaP (TraB family)
MIKPLLAALGIALALAGCKQEPIAADPALWHVVGTRGEEAWLFGTIHAAPAPIAWKTPKVAEALGRSGAIMVEVSNLADEAAVAQAFTALSRTRGLPPVEQRVAPEQRAALNKLLAERKVEPGDLQGFETWAVALTLARPGDNKDARNGIDRAVLADAAGKPVIELEGASRQLAIFDALPEADQRDLLRAVVTDADALGGEDEDLAATWRKGDMARIEVETRTGMLADPELRKALFTDRNLRWSARIVAEMNHGRRPFVAVGAAHMAGPDGLVARLQGAGYTVTRVR